MNNNNNNYDRTSKCSIFAQSLGNLGCLLLEENKFKNRYRKDPSLDLLQP